MVLGAQTLFEQGRVNCLGPVLKIGESARRSLPMVEAEGMCSSGRGWLNRV